ncbi:MAG: Trk system potassium transporter TrkA [Deinococcota bacterium]
MNIIIVGANDTAEQIADALYHGHNVTILDNDPVAVEAFEAMDVQVMIGNGADPKALREAGADKANALIACTMNDDVNVLSCLAAKGLGSEQTMAFVTRERYIEAFAQEGPMESVALVIDRILWPQRTLANQIVDIVQVPRALDSALFANGKIKLLEYRLEAHDPLTDIPLSELSLPQSVLVAGTIQDDHFVVPSGQTVLNEGDRVIFMGTAQSMRQIEVMFAPKKRSINVTLVGGGNVGSMVAKQLQAGRTNITIIEADEARAETLAEGLPKVTVLKGDGTDLDLLEQERMEDSDVLVAITDDDAKNLLVSLLAKELGIPKVITRVSNAGNRRVFQRLGIDSPLAAYTVAVQEVLNWLHLHDVDHLASIEGRADVLELVYPHECQTGKLSDLGTPPNSLIGAIVRKNKVIIPKGETRILHGDQLYIVTTPDNVEAVHAWLEPKQLTF